jgi:tRNA(Arg) A34 adenosine deaminase TadA
MRTVLNKKYMRLAIKEAGKNITQMQGGPFGACIVKENEVIALARNTVLKNDPTCHAEINAIKIASKKLKTIDLSGCHIYSTTEPCPMCFSAIHWARIDLIVFGTNISDVKKIGFNELTISNSKLKRLGKSKIKIKSDFLRKECYNILSEWNDLENKMTY